MPVKTQPKNTQEKLFQIPPEFDNPEAFEERCNFLAHGKDEQETAEIIMDWVHNYFERWVPAINRPILDFLSQQKIFRYELPYNFLLKMGNCGLTTTVFNLFCQLSALKSRRVSFWGEPVPGCEPVGHTLAEVEINGKWRLFDPSTNICWQTSLSDIVTDPEQFYAAMDDSRIDAERWRRGRLWAICNDKLYATIRRIEYLDIKSSKDSFEYEEQPRVAEYLTEAAAATQG